MKSGYIQFFSNDIDGVFYIKAFSGKVFLNSIESEYAESFEGFVNRLLDE
ncbi:hypothetical protein JCM19275_3718 [Nonlabens ulvanivorans]|uniref:Uncharacterized protein n=1 Tax=Nonlabens ulvanivorans TaxID=906888 RepID=A0A090QGD1_NONUL|nr:hypothetical protein [Nonlabens ulvanivorans]GAL01961.1 hypothetical protein JCM19314_598 [Nonlabens ulvanivorans]GAL77004.1 hypothetical protein JCM19275_3718 [Nonlabens ulvanivorans]